MKTKMIPKPVIKAIDKIKEIEGKYSISSLKDNYDGYRCNIKLDSNPHSKSEFLVYQRYLRYCLTAKKFRKDDNIGKRIQPQKRNRNPEKSNIVPTSIALGCHSTSNKGKKTKVHSDQPKISTSINDEAEKENIHTNIFNHII